MDASKEATQFVQSLADKFLRRGNVVSLDKTTLRQHFKVEVQKLKDDDCSLAEFLSDNQSMYSKSFIKLVKLQLKNSSNLKNVLANDKKSDSGKLPYNLFSSSKIKKKNIEKQCVDDRHGIYSVYLYEQLSHIQSCDDVLELLHCCRSCEKSSWFEDIQKMCTILNFQMEPKVLQLLMEIFSGKLSEELQRSGQHEKSLTKMKSVIEDFITLCTRKNQEIKDFPTKPKYNDLLASIVSMYIDVILLIFRNRDESEKRKEGRRLCGWVRLVFCSNPDFILDVLVQVSVCKSCDGPIVLPLCNKALAKPNGEYDAAFYTKYIVAVAQYTKQFPEPMSDILLESRNVPAPSAYLEWLRGKDASIADLLVANNKTKKTRITKYLLRDADEDLLSKLLDLLVDSDGSSKLTECLLEGVPGVAESTNADDPDGQLDEVEVAFCIDRGPAEMSQHFSFYRQSEEEVAALDALYFESSAHAEVEDKAQRNESGDDSTEEMMELEEFQAENDSADEQKEEEEIEEERDEDEKDFEMEDENDEDDENIRKKEEKLVKFIESCDDSKEEWRTTAGLPKMRTSPPKPSVSPLKMAESPLRMAESPPKMISDMKTMTNASPRKVSSSPRKIKGSSQKESFSQDVVTRSRKTPEKLALSPSSSSSMEDSGEEEFEGKTMTPQKMTTESQNRTISPQKKITLSPSSSSVENSDEDIEGEELGAEREKLTAGEEVIENSGVWVEKSDLTSAENKKEAVEAKKGISSSKGIESHVDESNSTGFVTAKNFKRERGAGGPRQSAKESPEDANKEPNRTTSKSLKKSTLNEFPSEASTYSLVLEESADEEQSERLVNQVLEFIDHSNASENDLFEDFEGVRCETSNQQKRLTESEENNSTAVSRLSPPWVDPAVLKSPRHTNRDPVSGRFAKPPPSSLMPGFSPPELPVETSERRRRSTSAKSVTPVRQEVFGTPRESSKDLDETTIPDSSEQSTPEHKKKSGSVPDLSKFLESPCHNKNVYDFVSDSSPMPQFTSILTRHKNSERERKESDRNSPGSVNPRSARSPFNKTYSHDRTNIDKKHSTVVVVDDAKQAGERSGIDRKLAGSPRKIIPSPNSSSPENVPAVGRKKSKLEARDTSQIRRSERILQQMKQTPTKEKTKASSPSSSSRKRRASSSENLQKTLRS